MRIAIAEIVQESDSFTPVRATLDDFRTYGLYHGRELLEVMPRSGVLGAFLDVADEQHGVEIVPVLRGYAAAGGKLDSETFNQLLDDLVTGLREAGSLDAVFLSLHGAASAEHEDDVEGAVLEAVRQVVGTEIPVVVPFDHHANITCRMMQHATLMVGHQTQPHDTPHTGKVASELLFRLLNGEFTVAKAWRKIPMITPQDQFLTAAGPMKEWFDLCRELERRPGVLSISPVPMQPWLDVAEGGWAVTVYTAGDQQLAEQIATEAATFAWQHREEYWKSERVAPDEAIRRVTEPATGLTILSDTGDSVYGGAPGDSTVLLRELIRQQDALCGPVLVPLIDPATVQAAVAAGIGNPFDAEVGAKRDSVFSQPVRLQGKVAALSSGGQFLIEERGACTLEPAALIECGQIKLAVLSRPAFAINHPALYRHLGLEVSEARAVVVKTASNFQFFAPWRVDMIRCDSPGMTQSNLKAFDWQRLPRPTWPLDEQVEWDPATPQPV